MPEVRSGSAAPTNRSPLGCSWSSALNWVSSHSCEPDLLCQSETGELQKHTPAAPECTNPLLARQELAKYPVQHGLLAAESVESDTMGTCWRTREWTVNQGVDTKPSFIQHWAVPSAKSSDTWNHNKFPYRDTKEMCADVQGWLGQQEPRCGNRATLGYLYGQRNAGAHRQSKRLTWTNASKS